MTQWLTLHEAAGLLGLSVSTLRVQVRGGRLAGKKIGPLWFVEAAEVARYRRESLGKPGPKK